MAISMRNNATRGQHVLPRRSISSAHIERTHSLPHPGMVLRHHLTQWVHNLVPFPVSLGNSAPVNLCCEGEDSQQVETRLSGLSCPSTTRTLRFCASVCTTTDRRVGGGGRWGTSSAVEASDAHGVEAALGTEKAKGSRAAEEAVHAGLLSYSRKSSSSQLPHDLGDLVLLP